MTVEFKRYIPYTHGELTKGIKSAQLTDDWKLVKFKPQRYYDHKYDVILQHKKSRLKTVQFTIMNSMRQNTIDGKLDVTYDRRASIECRYGRYTKNIFEAFILSLMNAKFVVELFNFKPKSEPYSYATKKFGPIFADKRYK